MKPKQYAIKFQKPEEMNKLKKNTPARIGIGHCGPRYTTEAYLDYRGAQARANDAVSMEVPKEVVEKLGVFEVRTKCSNKYEMITRPDWGRVFSAETRELIREQCAHDVDVQIYFGDGLSSPCIAANIPDLYPALRAGLEAENLTVGTPFFVRYCRVNTARVIGPLVNARLTCVLIGERPGLITNESMSAYMAVNARPEMSESDYKVVSNISRVGMPPVEAAAYIVELIVNMLKEAEKK